jgi:hypothetical protein
VHDDTVIVERMREKLLMTFLPVSTNDEEEEGLSKPRYHRQIPQPLLDAHMPEAVERECLKCPTKYEGGRYYNVLNTNKPKKRAEPLYVPKKATAEDYSRDPGLVKLERLRGDLVREARKSPFLVQHRLRWSNRLMENVDYQTFMSRGTTFAEDSIMDLNHKLAKQMLHDDRDEDAYSSEHSSDYKDKVEYASDSPTQSGEEGTKLKKRRKSRDQEITEAEIELMEVQDENEDVVMDELENESISVDSKEKKRDKELLAARKARNLGRSADLGEEVDEGNTIFIDNLPNDEFGMRKMIAEAKRLVVEYERQFFEEEDSDREERLKTITNVTKHE